MIEPLARALRRPVVAVLVLLVVYVGLSFANDPRGYLGTDTGGKVATLKVMKEHHRIDPDVGYWAEKWDPTGALHPLYYTSHIGGRWVNATTLPMLYAAYPLYRVGGYRATLVLPMLGSILAALAAMALAARLGAGERWRWAVFWLVGLASPLTIYALDFWEHSVGVALVAWAAVFLFDLAHGDTRWWRALGAGLLLGAAATMRTEALVYAAVITGVACVVQLVRSRKVVPVVIAGLAVSAGLVLPLVANNALEHATAGGTIRATRAAGTVTTQQVTGGRFEEAVLTAVGLNPELSTGAYVVGVLLLALLVLVALRSASPEPLLAVGAGVAALLLYILRFAQGPGFVPGLVATTPIAAVAPARGWADARARVVLGFAVVALPLVWAYQFTGGAVPQWAGRYILPSGFLLLAVGAWGLPALARWARVGFIGLAVAVTAFGLAWLSIRTHDVARASAALVRAPEPVLVSRVAHLAREGGAFYDDRHWLTAVTQTDLDHAVDVVQQAGFQRFGVVSLDAKPGPDQLGSFHRVGFRRVRFFSGVYLRITTYA
ncbi:MAG: hypothetical protein JOZ37_04230 [Actinobacteria bacterium]|nr:hypothetical protein [Actinomycetota bacterium]